MEVQPTIDTALRTPRASTSIFGYRTPWGHFHALLPPVDDSHPLSCHRPRACPTGWCSTSCSPTWCSADPTPKHADATVSATTLRTRRDEWIAAGVFDHLEQIILESYDRIVGLDLIHLSVDGYCVKAPCGGDNPGRNPTVRGNWGK